MQNFLQHAYNGGFSSIYLPPGANLVAILIVAWFLFSLENIEVENNEVMSSIIAVEHGSCGD